MPHDNIKQLNELREHRAKVLAAGGDDKIKKQHEKGLLSARERILALFQPDTFQEMGAHIQHTARHFGMDTKDLPCDGVICGTGYWDGTPVAAFSQDFTVAAGTLGKMHAQKIVTVMRFAIKMGMPLVAFKDSGGARIQEGVDALSGYGEVFYHNVLMSGVVPQIAIIAGPCAGGAAYSPALMDFIIMTKKNAYMFITGPEVIKTVTGRVISMDELGSAMVHASVSGNVHFVAEDDRHAIQIAQRLLSYLPANNTEDPPHRPNPDIALSRDEAMNGSTIYTPEVFAGMTELPGWNRHDIFEQRTQAVNRQPARARISVLMRPSGSTAADLEARFALDDSTRPGPAAQGAVIVFEKRLSTEVRAGENKGARLDHDNVVRYWSAPVTLDAQTGRAAWRQTVKLPADWKRENLGIAALVQDAKAGEVLQAVSMPGCV